MSHEPTAEAPETAPSAQPTETLPAGSAGDPSAPKVGKRDWYGAAMAKLKEVAGDDPAPKPAEGAPAAPEQPAETPDANPDADSPFARIARGEKVTPKPKEAEPALDESDPRTAATLAKLVELEQEARRQRDEYQQKQQTIAQREAQLAKWAEAHEALEGGSKLAALQKLGLTYEELTAEALKGDSAAGLAPLTEKLTELEQRMEAQKTELQKEYEQKLREAQQQAFEAQQTAYKQQQARLLQADRERWGFLNDPAVTRGQDPVEMVLDAMAADWEAQGRPEGYALTFEQAADKLEAEYERHLRESLASGQSKLAQLLQRTAPTASPETSASTPADRSSDAPASATLNPALASRTPSEPSSSQKMTREDYRRRALEAAARLAD